MNAPDAGDNSLAIDERMLLDVELLDWFFSKVSSVIIEHNYRQHNILYIDILMNL